ncbi:hypothetical protein HYY74_00820 [Candidatus Woesearchaeota archaeon]|nr:hypothetical protein [Candidatus Woesearchaeota archaeon]
MVTAVPKTEELSVDDIAGRITYRPGGIVKVTGQIINGTHNGRVVPSFGVMVHIPVPGRNGGVAALFYTEPGEAGTRVRIGTYSDMPNGVGRDYGTGMSILPAHESRERIEYGYANIDDAVEAVNSRAAEMYK